ncbi:MAG: glycoside hydrolase family 3 N-terminal domain-containing protein [Propionibacteriaceae bacterium]
MRRAKGGQRAWFATCALMIPAALAGCGAVPTAAPPVAVTPSEPTRSSQPTTPPPSPGGTPTPEPAESFTVDQPCAELVRKMSLSERVGQLLMVAVSSNGIGASERAIIDRTRTGSVILLGNSRAGTETIQGIVGRVRDASHSPEDVKVMLAADQEGGLVQRLTGPGFTTIPSATRQAKQSDGQLRDNAYDWGRELKEAGIDANLAPVADVVPRAMIWMNQPIGQLRRGYGNSPKIVAAKVTSFTEGMDRAGVATAVKHFPGLGRVRGNTDFMTRVIDRTTTRHDPALAGFSAAVKANVDMVMMSSAFYPKIDDEHRAAYSSVIMEDMLREDLGFTGVVISDDLAAAAMRTIPPDERPIRFIRAGGDLLIIGDASLAITMANAIKDEASDDADFAKRVTQSAARVVAMKERRGLARC